MLVWGRDYQNWKKVSCPSVWHLRWVEQGSSPENEFSSLRHLRETNNHLIFHAFHQFFPHSQCLIIHIFPPFIHSIFQLLLSRVAFYPSFNHLHRAIIFLQVILPTCHVNIKSWQITGHLQVFFGPAILVVGQAGITALQVELNGQAPVCVVGEQLLTFTHYRKTGRTSSWETPCTLLHIHLHMQHLLYLISPKVKWLYNALDIHKRKIILIITDKVTVNEPINCLY